MRIGITGGIASGKSLVATTLKSLGAFVVDADEVYHRLIEPGMPLFERLVSRWGTGILDDGRLDRKKLGAIVFSNPDERRHLEEMTHPAIITAIEEQLGQARSSPAVLVAPLLLEAGQRQLVDQVWLVVSDPEARISRLMTRESISREDALQRIQSQMSDKEKMKLATAIIDNNGAPEETKLQVKKLWERVKGSKEMEIELIDDNYCFACGTDNPISLRLTFQPDGDGLSGEFTPGREHQGYKGIIHGGILSTLLDEAMARLLINRGFKIVTVKMEIRYKKPVHVGEKLIIKAALGDRNGRLVQAKGRILNEKGELAVMADATFAEVQ